MNANKAFLLFTVALSAMLVAFYWPWLIGASSFYQSDLTYYFEPFSRFICDAYRHGRLPLWNPFLYCGMSQIAVPSPGPFYPGILCFMWLNFSQGIALTMILHQFVAGCGAFLLAGALGFGVPGALIAGVGCALCGYLFALQANYTLICTIAWLPLLLYVIYRIDGSFTAANVLRMLACSVLLFLMISAGRPELSVPGALLAVLVAVTPCVAERFSATSLRLLLMRAVGLAGGVLMSMPVILPALEWAKLSPRAHGLELKWVLMWSANWYDLLGLVCPFILGDLTRLGNTYLNLVASRLNSIPYVTSSYVGPLVATYAIWALFDRRHRIHWLVLGVGVALALMAVGSNTPVATWLCSLSPAFTAFRYPVKLMVFPALVLILLAAQGFSCSTEKRLGLDAQMTTGVLWCSMVLAGCLFLAVPSLSDLVQQLPYNAGHSLDMVRMRKAQLLFGQSFVICGALGLLANTLYVAYVRLPVSSVVYTCVVALAVAANLLVPAWRYARHGTIADFYRRPSAVANRLHPLLGTMGNSREHLNINSRFLTLYWDPLTPNFNYPRDVGLNFQQSFYLYTRALALPNNHVDYKLPHAFGYEAAEVGDYKQLYIDVVSASSQNRRADPASSNDLPLARFCRLAGVSTVLTQHYRNSPSNLVPAPDPEFFTPFSIDAYNNLRFYGVKSKLPRAYFASHVRVGGPADVREAVMDDDSRSVEIPTFVETPGERVPEIMNLLGRRDASPSDSIAFDNDTANDVSLTVSSDQSNLLVLTDQWYPGWVATLDGGTTRIYRVNGFWRGVSVPAGTHRINFRYEPESLRVGFLAASLPYLLYFAGLAWLTINRRWRSTPDQTAPAADSADRPGDAMHRPQVID